MDISQIPRICLPVVKSDTEPNNGVAFMVGVAGDVAIMDGRGNVTTIPACQPGNQVVCEFQKIMSTNTNASGIVRFA